MSRLRQFSQILFGLMLFLLLVSHASSQGGPFSWLPLPLPTAVSGYGWQIGVLSLLPLLVVGGWWLGSQTPTLALPLLGKGDGSLSLEGEGWGEGGIVVPLATFSLLVLLRLNSATVHLVAMLGLCWLIYLFLVNHPTWQQKWLWRVLAGVLLVQGAVAVCQFILQRELGSAWLGEPTLDLLVEGTSVAQRDGQNWLRAYGLNSHPNQLGLLLTTLILLIWPQQARLEPLALRGFFWLALLVGVAGLLVSLSRSAWLALGVGGVIFLIHRRPALRRSWRHFAVPLAILLASILLFVLVYGDLMASRLVALDSPLESRSLWERQRDLGIAVQLIGKRPFLGTGLGQYLAAAQAINPSAVTVHNVPLLMGAELGAVGLILWLLFWLWPLGRYGRSAKHRVGTAVWLALIVMGLVHPEPTLFLPKGAVLWGLAAAQWHAVEPGGGE
ncbi:O-antigen ligase family protein [Candidatus Leptofilum sp.]|uniref:O-antigen ligase family protein n=1 Tax=Candidatus Leptofilum sp. TaxID=3241576 RepID=UPI003B5B3A44